MSEQLGAAGLIVREIDGQRMGRFCLKVTGIRPVRPRAGWLYVDIDLADPQGEASISHFVTAIVSGGGRGVKQWVECRIFPQVELPVDADDGQIVDARKLGLEAGFISLLGRLIPDGGHLMIDYDSGGQDLTLAELVARVPPVASYLGELMFRAGFRGQFKDWYFSEGGHEGPRKLQANKSPHPAAARTALAEHLQMLKQFVRRPLAQEEPARSLIGNAIARARRLIKDFGVAGA
ncbi:MAG TPA: DUF1122 family protein [Candidatus Binataceae bacterium]|jgi:hypothetical protein|nr:DUF1122 family protein [Candidatus Binataceae bacterium]